jgi:putative copper resistance protein D
VLFLVVPTAAGHGLGDDLPPLDARSALTLWAIDVPLTVLLIVLAAAYLWACAAVNRRHPASPVPWRRPAAWLGALVALGVALQSSVDVYAEALFSVHMVQHLLLVAIVAPLLALAAPATLLLRVASPAVRDGVLLPALRSRVVGVASRPLVGWLAFAAVMWISHFSPLFDASLESPVVHELEHALYLGAAMLFWWPVVAADPIRHRLGWTARIVYLGTALPWNSFLGVAIYFAPAVLYPHYATVVRTWGPTPLLDQQIAGAVMWVGGDLAFLVALLLVVAGLLADEERKGRILDARMDAAGR